MSITPNRIILKTSLIFTLLPFMCVYYHNLFIPFTYFVFILDIGYWRNFAKTKLKEKIIFAATLVLISVFHPIIAIKLLVLILLALYFRDGFLKYGLGLLIKFIPFIFIFTCLQFIEANYYGDIINNPSNDIFSFFNINHYSISLGSFHFFSYPMAGWSYAIPIHQYIPWMRVSGASLEPGFLNIYIAIIWIVLDHYNSLSRSLKLMLFSMFLMSISKIGILFFFCYYCLKLIKKLLDKKILAFICFCIPILSPIPIAYNLTANNDVNKIEEFYFKYGESVFYRLLPYICYMDEQNPTTLIFGAKVARFCNGPMTSQAVTKLHLVPSVSPSYFGTFLYRLGAVGILILLASFLIFFKNLNAFNIIAGSVALLSISFTSMMPILPLLYSTYFKRHNDTL